jgi:hypothetical protein
MINRRQTSTSVFVAAPPAVVYCACLKPNLLVKWRVVLLFT